MSTVCEGELDAMAAYQMLGSKYAAVSIKDGAAAAVKSCKRSYDFLNSFNNIVICFDSDDVGQKAAREVAQLFEPNKCKIVALDGKLKDACGYLSDGKSQDFTQAWWAARTYTPAGIINLKDIGPELYEEGNQTTCLYPWDGINQKLYGIRTGELVTLTAGTGTGKSSVMRELMHHVLKQAEGNIGVISLEENTRSTIFHLMSVEANARLYIREVRENFPDAELFKWQEATIGTGRFYAFDHFGSMGTEEILARVRYMVKALDCKWIFLDHLSILVSGLEGMDERRNIDILMTKLRSLVEETNCALLLVSHLRRTGADSGHEDGKEVSLSHLRGSQSIAQLSDTVVAMERDQQSDDPNISNTTTIRVLKNRYAGETGVACHLFFNKDTGRLHEVTNLGDDLDEGNGDNDISF
jgi:twinkle protein